jgi:RsiW-degrading membrane proteinase PrsW (M82 family)
MTFSVICECGKTLKAPPEMAGKRARCPNCKAIVHVPAAEPVMPVFEAAEPSFSPPPAEEAGYALSSEPPPRPVRPERPVPVGIDPRRPTDLHRAGERPLARTASPKAPPRQHAGAAISAARPALAVPRSSGRWYWLFALTLVPLACSLLASDSDINQRIERTVEAHPEVLMKLAQTDDGGMTKESLLDALPDGRLDDAHLSHRSWMHWLYAGLATAFFGALLMFLFDRGEATFGELALVGLATGTVGIILLISFQFVAGFTQNFWLSGRSVIVILFYIIKFIGFSYQAASDPSNGFLLSFLGFTLGVGLCEEFIKALPLYIKVRDGDDLSWRKALVWGLASGVGFGIAEGIMYSSDFYNGIATWGIYPVRFISCVALHALWTGSVALMLWHNQEVASGELDSCDWFLGLLKVQSVPMLLHGLYDTLLKRDMNALALLTAVASFGWFVFLMIKSHAADPEPERPERTALAAA